MVGIAIGLFLWIRDSGETLTTPAVDEVRQTEPILVGKSGADTLLHVLLALAVVVAVGRLLAVLFQVLHQPPVIGEVIGGILLGPSFLGAVAPSVYDFVLPVDVAPYLGLVAQLGVILYMFLVGLELNSSLLKKRIHVTLAISHASIVVPFVLGSALALYLYPRFATANVPFTAFALFLGLAMSITAFPVLARILSDRGMTRTELGAMALTCASVDDVTAWCMLAFVVGFVQTSGENPAVVAGLTLLYVAFLFFVVRPLMAKLGQRTERKLNAGTIGFVLILMLASAFTTELIGIHAIFGAFVLGAVVPHDSNLARGLTTRISDVVTILLLPAFFAYTGMRTQIGLVSTGYEWLICLLIILVAVIGKFGGTLAAARFSGLGWRYSAALGVLMNTRGLMELIVLNVGLELGVISHKLFAMLVIMAIFTTVMTTPILHALRVDKS